MIGRLAKTVQVRREDWGLLFYSQARHKVCFIRSGNWLYPHYFDGTWSFDSVIADIARRTGTPAEIIERSVGKLTKHLTDKGMVIKESEQTSPMGTVQIENNNLEYKDFEYQNWAPE